jgi:hypothetical protein
MAMWAVSIPQDSSWEKLRGARFCERLGTLGGEGRLIIGVTTLGSNGALVMFERELLSVISFGAAGAREKLILDWMIWRGMCVE